MLIRVTEQCHMGCSHCFVDARPDGNHMDGKTYKLALEMANRIDRVAMLSGGEPTEHPDILDFIAQAKKQLVVTSVLSNGMFLDDAALSEKLLATGVSLQITNDQRFYPRTVLVVDHPRLLYTHRIRSIISLGRGRRMVSNRTAPACFNLRSATRKYRDLSEAILTLRLRGYFCTPSIDVDGSVRAGETNQCYKIGSVGTAIETMVEKLCDMKCNKCGLEDIISPYHKTALYGRA